jgi:hypothetical protein
VAICEYYDECVDTSRLPAEQCEFCYNCGAIANTKRSRPFGSVLIMLLAAVDKLDVTGGGVGKVKVLAKKLMSS